MNINGFYTAFMSGIGGNGIAIFTFKDGIIIGADMGGVLFDGNYAPNETGQFIGKIIVKVPQGVTIIQGHTAPLGGMQYEVDLKLNPTFLSEPYFEIVTPIGNVNARLQKLRDF